MSGVPTPGLWSVPDEYPSEVERSDGKTVATCWHEYAVGKTITVEDVAPVSLAESRANARLIAAAPEMRDALLSARVAVRELCEGQHPENECWATLARIDAAIAKSEAAE